MRLDLHVFFENREGDPVVQQLNRILAHLTSLNQGVTHMTVALETLKEHVTAIETVGDSAIALLNGLKEQLDDAIAGNDTAALIELSERLGAQTQELADAIAANTPGA